LTEGKFTNFLL